ncbi:XRE family transcriptional regulator [Microbispora triticiradicis]|uniref:Helix-turn-helix domain-containing protein n=3 Tax=Microbispora TaxID=2005 RepID=A0ABY3LQE1_9ACTN|nr:MULTISPECIES: helix-turn-helix transcriptional regulator [Microbispora]RGA01245.1 XRE family transcriptional regulator [Microbispora triticiradicis]TLP54830.1 helix-turn-helix domain-containing protein [Microbispora fusca]TYB50125.1 helix-turn-helix domain-containing protein [Microbispora tritici]GLW22574.1 transcriptional regulator [Microbispora amethystogenes]
MTNGRGPTVRRRRLAGELRRLRERKELTLEDAAERLGWSAAKVSRIETARVGITSPDLTRMLDLYELADDRRAGLHALARTARTRGWWDAYADSLPSDYSAYIQLEADAAFIRSYDGMIVHGLLQTDEYAREIIRAALMGLSSPAEVERRVEVRMTRQRLLLRDESPLRFWTVVDEAALTRRVGSEAIMREQYARLLEFADRDNVTIQALPFAKGAHPATAGTFALLEFRESHDPNVVYVEGTTSNLYVESDAEIYRYSLAFDHLRAMALDPDESRRLIARLAEGSR